MIEAEYFSETDVLKAVFQWRFHLESLLHSRVVRSAHQWNSQLLSAHMHTTQVRACVCVCGGGGGVTSQLFV